MNPESPNQQQQYQAPDVAPATLPPAPVAGTPVQLQTRSWPTSDDPGYGFAIAGAIAFVVVGVLVSLPLMMISKNKSKQAGYSNTWVNILLIIDAVILGIAVVVVLFVLLMIAIGAGQN